LKPLSTEHFPIISVDVSLRENAAQRTDWDLVFARDDRNVSRVAGVANKFDVAALLAGFHKARSL
jgi:hypothetical protein